MRGVFEVQRSVSALSVLVAGAALAATVLVPSPVSADTTHAQITGSGSSWAANAVNQWIADVQSKYQWSAVYTATGSAQGRSDFAHLTTDFGVTELPYDSDPSAPVTETAPAFGYTYVPFVGGALSLPYHLEDDGRLISNVRLSSATIAGMFTGSITYWDDRAVELDNPGLLLPHVAVKPVVHSEGSEDSALLSGWIKRLHPDQWSALCLAASLASDCAASRYFPNPGAPFVAQNGSDGVMNYLSSGAADGAIGYDEYSYSLAAGLPVAKVMNASNVYVAPKAPNVSLALRKATVPDGGVPDLTGVQDDTDRRSYPLSYVASALVPTAANGRISDNKAHTLQDFVGYGLCEGSAESATLGDAPLPANLVSVAFNRLGSVPGADPSELQLATCGNPTMLDGVDRLGSQVPQPPACDDAGPYQCGTFLSGPLPMSLVGATSRTIAAGHSSNLTAALVTNVDGIELGIAGAPIVFEHRLRGASTWTGAVTRATDARARVSLWVKPSATTSYRMRFVGEAPFAGTASSLTVAVRYVVTAKRAHGSVRHGRKDALSGRLAPALVHRKVYLEERKHGRWVLVRSVRTGANGRYTFNVTEKKRGTYTYRVTELADASHLAGSSPSTKIRFT